MTGVLAYSFIDREGSVIAEKNADVPLMPASNMKILTGIAAYKFLGEGHKFNTYFSMTGRDLLVSGGPSPLLTAAELEELAHGIIKMGHEVNRIVIDNCIFDRSQYGPGWMIDDRKYTYQTKISPISVNEGCLPRGWKDSELKDLPLAHTREDLHPVQSQSRSFCTMLWKSLGKTGKPICVIANDRVSVDPILIHNELITDVISHVEKLSCNFSSEVILKYLAYKKYGKPGSWKDGVNAVLNELGELGLDTGGIRMVDGSGLSRLNLLNTRFLADLIYRISNSKYKEFLKFLPQPGLGTLKNRLHDLSDLTILAKTGSISYCASLTGYIEKLGISFSIIANNFIEGADFLVNLVDDTLRSVVRDHL